MPANLEQITGPGAATSIFRIRTARSGTSSKNSFPGMMERCFPRRNFPGSSRFRSIFSIRRSIRTQISRFDRLKDPVGVIRAYRIVKRYFDCQLVLAGGGAADDPEGAVVLKEVLREADNDPDIKILELPTWAPLEVNALQRASTVVIQKSLREGFGLTVS